MSRVRREPSLVPTFISREIEWLPTLGVSWPVVHVPWITGWLAGRVVVQPRDAADVEAEGQAPGSPF